METPEQLASPVTRYRIQFIIAITLTILIGGLAIFSDIQSLRLQNELTTLKVVKTIVLSLGGVYSFCWTAFFLFYLDEWILSIKANFVTKMLMTIYNIDIIKVTFTLLGGVLVTFITFGIFGLVRNYLVWKKVRAAK